MPALILHGDKDPVVRPKSGRLLFERIGSEHKEFDLLHCSCHVMLRGPDAEMIQDRLGSFIRTIS